MRPRNILILLLLALIILLAIWRPWRNQGPNRPSLRMSSVVILPFAIGQVDEDLRWLESGLVDMFATKLNHLPSLRAVSLEELLERADSSSLRRGLSKEEALHQLGTEAALTGSISPLGSGFRMDIRLMGKGREELLLDDTVVANRFEDLFAAVDSISLKVVEALGWKASTQLPPIAQVTSSSLLAYGHYTMAVEDYVISDDSSMPRAADHLQLAGSLDSTFARAHFLMAKVCDQAQALGIPLGSAEDPLILAERFGDRLPEWERQYAQGWHMWLVEGDLEGAVAVLTGLSEKYQSYAWQEGVPLTVGRLLAHQGQWPRAIQQLKAYVRAQETPALRRALGWGQLATAYLMTGDADGAIEAIERELSLFSGREGNRYWWIQENMTLALLYFENWNSNIAEKLLAQANELASSDARALAMIGLTRFQMRQEKRAEALARRALRLEGDLAPAHYLLGLLSLRSKEYRSAVANLEAACSLEFNWDFLYHAALAHAKQGNRQSAEELLEFMIEIFVGEDLEAVGPADQAMLGILLSRLGRHEEALAHGLKAVQRFPYPQAKYDLACIYAIQGDKPKAVEWLRAAFADGYVNQRQSRVDFNLENLWFDPDFILLTAGE